ncbi:MAG: tRNA (N(6)-L-threonylcarbamoyladenosine(37)-C(2))-methylthiotransferase MtaB [Ruminococcaceae bacterium]|nr:tRNA (N(6)-L-threonylcarbamoyladenosine(37)-C(2))-methylthiotransferase MtaB [Oscillospiraceae bacterium]
MLSTHSPAPTAAILTLGCKVNQYESEALAETLADAGFIILPPHEICDLYIVNSCTVTAESDRKSRQAVRRLIKQNPKAVVIVTGCSAETDAKLMADISGVDAVVGNKEKLKAVRYALSFMENGKPAEPVIDVPSLEDAPFEPMVITHFDRTRAYVKIQDGCESRCTYCTIPAARGRERSKPLCDVVREVARLTHDGCREVVLTGIETGAWGKDLGKEYTLAALLRAVADIPNVGRIRLGSLDPTVITEDFADTVAALPCVAPHFHLSMQSGCSATLARMKRKYNVAQAERAMERLRTRLPSVKFTTDIIAGFPGETEEEFAETLAFARRAGFLHIHAFPYSKRVGTPAATMKEQVPEEIKHRRVRLLNDVSRDTCQALLSREVAMGRPLTVLFETYRADTALYHGHTPDFMEVTAPASWDVRGQEVIVVPMEIGDGVLIGRILTDPTETTKSQVKELS